jgi:hypothetical protein
LPKRNIASVNQLLGGFDCCVVVIAVENDRFDEMAVLADDLCAVVGHADSREQKAGAQKLTITGRCRDWGGDR